MSVLQYASKLMKLSHFAQAYVANETLKTSRFESGLNHKPKVTILVCTYSSYQEIYHTAINVKCAQQARGQEEIEATKPLESTT